MAAIRLMLPLLLLAYPLVSHFSAVSMHPELSYFWLGLILLGAGLSRAPKGRLSWSTVPGLALIGASIEFGDQLAELPAKLLPVVAYFGLSLFFAYSLMPGKTPLITRIMQRIRSVVPPRVLTYCRRLTGFWTAFLFLLGVQSLALSLFAPASLWSIFANFVNPALIALVFIVEYPIRRLILKEVHQKGFFAYTGELIRIGLPGEDTGCDAHR